MGGKVRFSSALSSFFSTFETFSPYFSHKKERDRERDFSHKKYVENVENCTCKFFPGRRMKVLRQDLNNRSVYYIENSPVDPARHHHHDLVITNTDPVPQVSTHLPTPPPPPPTHTHTQSWALSLFCNFSYTRKIFFIFYQVNNLFLHQSYFKDPLPVKLT